MPGSERFCFDCFQCGEGGAFNIEVPFPPYAHITWLQLYHEENAVNARSLDHMDSQTVITSREVVLSAPFVSEASETDRACEPPELSLKRESSLLADNDPEEASKRSRQSETNLVTNPSNQSKNDANPNGNGVLQPSSVLALKQEDSVSLVDNSPEEDSERAHQSGTDAVAVPKIDSNFSYIGDKVAKMFANKLYFGSITGYRQRLRFWQVKYDDGDEEEFNKKELTKALDLYQIKGPVMDISDDDDVEIVSEPLTGLSKVKQEIWNKSTSRQVSHNYEDRKRRLAARSIALRDPNGAPRKTFRRGCHKATITTVLGGSPMDPAPIVMNVPTEGFPNGKNPFIKEGEFYFAGAYLWNPWTPVFPGDIGLIQTDNLKYKEKVWSKKGKEKINIDRGKQETFHCFMECSKRKYDCHYLGPNNPKGTRLYLGRYRKVPEDRNEVNITEESMEYSSLEWECQFHIAKWFVRRDAVARWIDLDGKKIETNKDLLTDNHVHAAKTKAENELQGKWLASCNEEQKQTRAWIEMLTDFKYRLYITPVEFVDYDEKLYEKLVSLGADNGCVSLDESELGPL